MLDQASILPAAIFAVIIVIFITTKFFYFVVFV